MISICRVLVVTTALSIISRCSIIQQGLTFWYQLNQVVVEHWPILAAAAAAVVLLLTKSLHAK